MYIFILNIFAWSFKLNKNIRSFVIMINYLWVFVNNDLKIKIFFQIVYDLRNVELFSNE